jgi:hypothetical protein
VRVSLIHDIILSYMDSHIGVGRGHVFSCQICQFSKDFPPFRFCCYPYSTQLVLTQVHQVEEVLASSLIFK